MNDVLRMSDKIGPDYISAGAYHSYLQNKMYNEQRLASMLHSSGIIAEAGLNKIVAVNEGKVGDKAKANWKKFIEFIKGLVAKFMESITHLLSDNKTYLEKYKDIILKQKPKEDFEFSYTGDYDVAVNRLVNMEVPLFNYATHAENLQKDGNEEIINQLMNGKNGFTLDTDKGIAKSFKEWYLAQEKGQKTGKFEDLNFKEMYDFCYNVKKIENVVNKDVRNLEQSTGAIEKAIIAELQKNGENANAEVNDNATTDAQNGNSAKSKVSSDNGSGSDTSGGFPENPSTGQTVTKNGTTYKWSGTAWTISNESTMYYEADGVEVKSGKTELNIKSSDTSKNMTSYNDTDAKGATDDITKANAADAKGAKATEEQISKMTQKWINVCNPIITAKLTAYQQIAKDYMEIIRKHVRSYGGKDLKKDRSNERGTVQSTPQEKYKKGQPEPEDTKTNTNTTDNNQQQQQST